MRHLSLFRDWLNKQYEITKNITIDITQKQDIIAQNEDVTAQNEQLRRNWISFLEDQLILLNKKYSIPLETNQWWKYFEDNKYIFAWSLFKDDLNAQELIIQYKYITEQIQKEVQEKWFYTSQEYETVVQYWNFCNEYKINNTIKPLDLPVKPTEPLSSIRDLINHDNLGQHLYENNDGIKQFVDNKKSKPLNFDDKALVQNLEKIYPDAIKKNIDNLLLQKNITLQSPLDIKKLLSENTLNTQYLEENGLKDQISEIQAIINSFIVDAKNKIDDISQKTINQHTLWVCLQTVASYFDTVTLNMEDFAGDMKLNENNIQIQNNTVIIQGTIHGKSITISYDLQTGIIQSQDFILANTWVVYVWDTSKQQESLNFRWPTYDEIQKRATAYTTQSLANHVRWDFKAIDLSLRNGLHHKVPVKLDAVLWRDVMEHTIEKNIATKQIQNLLSLWLPTGQARSKGINPEIRQLYTIFDKSMDRYTPAELRKLRWLLTQLDTIIRPITQNTIQTQRQGQDPLWVFLFNQEKLQEDRHNKSDHNSFFKFFSALTYNKQDYYLEDVLNLHLIEKVINAYKKPKEEWDKIAEIQPLYEWYEESEKNADNILKELYT